MHARVCAAVEHLIPDLEFFPKCVLPPVVPPALNCAEADPMSGYGSATSHYNRASLGGDEDLQAQAIAEFADYQRLRQVQAKVGEFAPPFRGSCRPRRNAVVEQSL